MATPQDKANQILKEHWKEGGVPVSPSRIAASLGVAVTADPNMAGTSGHFDPHGLNGHPVITYNPNENFVRNRFTIAHELGHFVLGHNESDRNSPVEFFMTSKNQNEVDANKFAACLLMPASLVKAAITLSRINTVEDLAKLFRVSKAAMTYKLKELGYHV